jgi:hypothetical protein
MLTGHPLQVEKASRMLHRGGASYFQVNLTNQRLAEIDLDAMLQPDQLDQFQRQSFANLPVTIGESELSKLI